ncbi:MAG: ABC transporter permease [Eubacterium sp.]|nr:ABC transporter permease [Eubacterium sp.]
MFLHNLKYEIITSLRARDLIIWLMIFPIILGTFFKIAFGSMYEKDSVFKTIDVAIVEVNSSPAFNETIKSIESADQPMLKATYTSEADAMDKLERGDVSGIIYVDTKDGRDTDAAKADTADAATKTLSMMSETSLSLKVASNGMSSTILKKFIERYMLQEHVIMETIKNDPAKIKAVTDSFTEDISLNNTNPLEGKSTDPFLTYFYNLIAMVAMFGSVTGLHIAIGNQANLSALGARRNCSPTHKFSALLAGLTGSYIAQSVCVILCITFEVLVLGIDYGTRLPLVYVASILGGILGVSFGFLIGSIGSMKLGLKVGISMGISMVLCFMSGLMLGDMKPLIEQKAPIINDLNPVAIISDSIYYLNTDTGYDRFIIKIISMAAFSVIFVLLGFMLTRRKKYASI